MRTALHDGGDRRRFDQRNKFLGGGESGAGDHVDGGWVYRRNPANLGNRVRNYCDAKRGRDGAEARAGDGDSGRDTRNAGVGDGWAFVVATLVIAGS